MDCEGRQEELGLLLDGEAAATDHPELFAHLGACAGCRSWFDTLTRIRRAAGRDREEIAPAADTIAPPAVGAAPRASGTRRPRGPRRALRLPLPLAATLAVLLLACGALAGAGWLRLAGGTGPLAAGSGQAPVVVICSLPEVTVGATHGEAR